VEANSTIWNLRPPTLGWQQKPTTRAYRVVENKPAQIGSVAPRPRLPELLEALRGNEFAERMALLPPMREEHTLRGDPLVQHLIIAIGRDANAERKIERFLDQLFLDFRQGEVFEHTEAVMALLVALHHAGVEWLGNIAEAFTSSHIAEMDRIARLARRMVR
jgi:hypothetical protein